MYTLFPLVPDEREETFLIKNLFVSLSQYVKILARREQSLSRKIKVIKLKDFKTLRLVTLD